MTSSTVQPSPIVVRASTAIDLMGEPRYTIGSLVSDDRHYDALLASLRAGGFHDGDCEYLFIDNRHAIQTDAYAGLNALLNAARAPIVILCHQDVRLLTDTRETLDQRLQDLSSTDAKWAVAGNAGGVAPGRLALRITDPHGNNQCVGDLPSRAVSLDENFLVVRRDARIGFSADLSGFHFYGADICLHAGQMGFTCYVIDFHLQHLSPGLKSAGFAAAEAAFKSKWSNALAPRWLQTTCSLLHLTGDPARASLGRIIDAPMARLARRLPGARGWKKTAVKSA